MAHNHDHHGHSHSHEVTNINTAFIVGIILNIGFVIAELVIGYSSASLALISDAGHNATDVFGLILSMFAFKLSKSKANRNYTYGYKRATILNSLLNAILLLLVTGGIIYEGFYRLENPVQVQGKLISMVAFAGIFVNAISAYLFFKDKEKDINIKGAYLHLLSDALVAVGVVLAGIIIYYTHLFWIDTVISFVIAIIILISTWQLLTDSIRLALDGVPRGIDMEEVEKTILKFEEVKRVHHIHVWALSSNQNALTAHLIIDDTNLANFEKTKYNIKHALHHLHINHATLETETTIYEEASCGGSVMQHKH